MKIKILQIAKNKDRYIEAEMAEFLKRLRPFCVTEIITLKEVSPSKTFTIDRCIEEEGKMILKALGAEKSGLLYSASSEFLIVLDEHGKEFSSVEFSKMLKEKNEEGINLCFVIGGPFGLSKEVKQRAGLILSMSKMTLTHQMIRLLLLEQLYRGFCIWKGKEYHH
jgi:23S rRNA (pseudouridine1915-N3)-methyltransferase